VTSDGIKSGVYLVAIAAAGFLAWQAYKKGKGLADGVADLWAMGAQQVDQWGADAQSAIANHIAAPFEQGQAWVNAGQPVNVQKSFNELMYGNYGYTGQDASGQLVTDGEWYGNEDARRYDVAQPVAAKPAATSNNGAAFGVYPSAMGSNGQR
jgi:hypothetical protein